jgi:hypothetical protein
LITGPLPRKRPMTSDKSKSEGAAAQPLTARERMRAAMMLGHEPSLEEVVAACESHAAQEVAAATAKLREELAESDDVCATLAGKLLNVEECLNAAEQERDAALAQVITARALHASLQMDYDERAGEVQRVCAELEAEGQLRLAAEAEVARLKALLGEMEIDDVDGDGERHWFRCAVHNEWLDTRDDAIAPAKEVGRG